MAQIVLWKLYEQKNLGIIEKRTGTSKSEEEGEKGSNRKVTRHFNNVPLEKHKFRLLIPP